MLKSVHFQNIDGAIFKRAARILQTHEFKLAVPTIGDLVYNPNEGLDIVTPEDECKCNPFREFISIYLKRAHLHPKPNVNLFFINSSYFFSTWIVEEKTLAPNPAPAEIENESFSTNFNVRC